MISVSPGVVGGGSRGCSGRRCRGWLWNRFRLRNGGLRITLIESALELIKPALDAIQLIVDSRRLAGLIEWQRFICHRRSRRRLG
jgi:hypothetical protein